MNKAYYSEVNSLIASHRATFNKCNVFIDNRGIGDPEVIFDTIAIFVEMFGMGTIKVQERDADKMVLSNGSIVHIYNNGKDDNVPALFMTNKVVGSPGDDVEIMLEFGE